MNYEEFELGSGSSIEVKTFVERVMTELSKEKSINTVLNFGTIPYRENENMNMTANIEKLEQLGWKPKVSLENGIHKIIKEKV